jgi:hypothetical protein
MFGRRFAAPVICSAAMLLAIIFPPNASALVGDSNGPFGLDGSIRLIGVLFRNYDFDPYFMSQDTDEYLQGILRLTAMGRPSDRLKYEVHLVSALEYRSTGGELSAVGLGGSSGAKTRYRAWDTTYEYVDEEYTSGTAWFDRFNVKLHFKTFDLTLGRQAITFGKAYFWNPLDVYLPFDPAQFDRDYKPGVDAVRLDVPLGDFSGLTFTYVLGREVYFGQYVESEPSIDTSWYGSSALARYYTNISGWDLALQGGKIYGGYQLGFGLVGEVATIQVRAEAAQFWARDSRRLPWPYTLDLYENYFSGVIGLGRRFESSLDLEFEFLYNDGGEDNDLGIGLLRQQAGAVMHVGRYLAGLTATYEFTPLIVGRMAVIHSFTDSSSQIQPSVTWSVGDNSELLLAATVNVGDRPTFDFFRGVQMHSEFGNYPDYLFAEFKYYF